MLHATLGEPIPLQVAASDGRSDLFGRIRVIDSLGAVVATLSTTHVVDGLYGVSWTPSVEGYFSYLADLYFDAGFTIPASYERLAETIEVDSQKTNILRVLGLMHQNAVLDNQSYTPQGQLLSARIRVYDTKANAQLASAGGLRFVYTVQATYNATELTSYKILLEQ